MPEATEDKFDQAGLAIMREIVGVIRDRETVSDAAIESLTADDIQRMYFSTIAPAIDDLETQLNNAAALT